MTEPTKTKDTDTIPTPHGIEPVENRPDVGTTTPDAYPDNEDAGPGSGGGGKPDYGSPKR